LVDLINSPNSDQLLRDLAIKSISQPQTHRLLTCQSPSAASCSSAPKTT
jgi:hypothetical protein